VYPRLFQFGPFTLPTYGACLAIGLVAALFLALYTARRLRVEPESMWNLCMLVVFSVLLGTKLLLIVTNWHDFLHYPVLMLSLPVTRSISTLLSGFLLALITGLIYMRVKKMPWLRTLDAAAPPLALAASIASLGAFAAGSGYGTATTLPWGVIFRNRWAAYWYGTPLGVRLHPTQMYECVLAFLLCVFLLWLLPRRRQDGEGIGAWLFLYGLVIFWLDFFRGDASRKIFFAGTFSITQSIAFVVVIAGALLWLQRPAPSASAPDSASDSSSGDEMHAD
jgi:phosphatidylglycerol:prolipoprotein diacylglycerol transferase